MMMMMMMMIVQVLADGLKALPILWGVQTPR